MALSPTKGLTKKDILTAIAEFDSGVPHNFGQPIRYELVFGGKRYPPKAIVGLALSRARGKAVGPDDFSAGEAPGQANYVLRHLGFEVVAKSTVAPRLGNNSRDGYAAAELAKVHTAVEEEGYFSPD